MSGERVDNMGSTDSGAAVRRAAHTLATKWLIENSRAEFHGYYEHALEALLLREES